MSQKPPGVMLYPQDLLPLVGHLPQDAAGRLLSAILNYSEFGVVPLMDKNDPEYWVWPAVKDRIDRDRKAYNEKCERARANGKRGGRPRKNQAEEPEDEPEETEENQEEPDAFFDKLSEPEETEGNPEKPEKANNNYNPNPNSNYNGYSSPQRAGARGGERNVENPVEKQTQRLFTLRQQFFDRMAKRQKCLGIEMNPAIVSGLYRSRMIGISVDEELLILEAMEAKGYDQIPEPAEWIHLACGAAK